jgi:hypothetical protein
MGMISSKNLLSTGLMALSGCVTKMIEYSTTNTMPIKVRAKQIPMKNLSRTMSSSSVYLLDGLTSLGVLMLIIYMLRKVGVVLVLLAWVLEQLDQI